MLNQTTEHAIRALLFLAQRVDGESVPAVRIAQALGAPANYLSKTLNQLARRGLVGSSRGPLGGFRLMKPAREITLSEVAELFSDQRSTTMCLLGDRPCSARTPCTAHFRWVALRQAAEAPLRGTTLADLLTPNTQRDPAGGESGNQNAPAADAA